MLHRTSGKFRFPLQASLAAAILLMVLCVPGDAQVPANIAEQQRRAQLEQFRNMANLVHNMPKLDVKRIDEVLQVQVQDGKSLVCISPALDKNDHRGSQFRLDIEGFKGPTYVQVSNAFVGRRVVAGPKQPMVMSRTVTFTSYEMPDPDTFATLTVQSYPSMFHIERNTQSHDVHSLVRLMEQRNPDLPNGGFVQLWVSSFGGAAGQPVNVNLQEPDFPTLVHNHPQEVEQHLRPLLARLGQEQLFSPALHVAWQVLAEYWPADAKIGQQVQDVLPALDDPDFRQREKALAELVHLDREGATVLRKLNRAGLSPEQNRLIDLALAPYDQLSDRDAVRLGGDKTFLLDCLYSEDESIRKAAMNQLRKVSAREDLKFDADAATADRSIAIRTLRQQVLGKPATQPSAN